MFRPYTETRQRPRKLKYRHAKFGPVPNWSKSERSFGSESGPTSGMTVVSWWWAVNGQEVLVCPKLQYSIGIVYGMLRAPKNGGGSSTTGAELRYKCRPGLAVCRMPAPRFRRSVPTQRSVLYTASFRQAPGESSCYLRAFRVSSV